MTTEQIVECLKYTNRINFLLTTESMKLANRYKDFFLDFCKRNDIESMNDEYQYKMK